MSLESLVDAALQAEQAPPSLLRTGRAGLTAELATVLAALPSETAVVRGMRWQAAELGAHLVASRRTLTDLLNGRQTPYGLPYTANAHIDDAVVTAMRHRDPALLATMLRDAAADLDLALASINDEEVIPDTAGMTVGLALAQLLVDGHVHGSQLAAVAGRRWRLDVAPLRRALLILLPAAFQPAQAAGVEAVVALHLEGDSPLVFQISAEGCVLAPSLRADCHLYARPEAILAVLVGVVPLWRALGSGGIRVTGRRPLLARQLRTLFRLPEHGGLARDR